MSGSTSGMSSPSLRVQSVRAIGGTCPASSNQ
jgi:hypothetical protein